MARNRLLHHITVALVASTLLGGAAIAQNQPSKGEQALKYRKSLYQVASRRVSFSLHGTWRTWSKNAATPAMTRS